MSASLKVPFLCVIIIIFLPACQNNNSHIIKSAFQKSLVQKKIKGAPYYLSMPANYIIKENNGPDFSVYYFYPSDSTDKKSFRGGFYLGNAPGSSGMNYSNCKVENLHSSFLGDNKQWTIYNCGVNYAVQIITDSKSDMAWGHFIHAFGWASSKTEVNKLLEVYSTLTTKK